MSDRERGPGMTEPTNTVELSEDRRHMKIRSWDGKRTAYLRSARPDGFTNDHAFDALEFDFTIGEPGRHVAWRKHVARDWYLFAGVQTGPPTWWWPRVKIGRIVLVGWLRTAVEVSIRREKNK